MYGGVSLKVWRSVTQDGVRYSTYVYDTIMLTLKYKVCYYSITHTSDSSSLDCRVAPAFDRLPALPLQVWLTVLEQDGPPTPASPS